MQAFCAGKRLRSYAFFIARNDRSMHTAYHHDIAASSREVRAACRSLGNSEGVE